MRRSPLPLLSALAIAFACTPLALAAAPRVVSATPDNGDTDVDPATREIRVEFDQDMSHSGHSICGGGPQFPKISGKPHWSSARVFILPVTLEPKHEYSFMINCPAARNFRNTDGESAEPYPISFKTAAPGKAASKKKLTPAANRKAIAALTKAIDDSYAYRDLHHVDWPRQIKAATPKLEKAATPAAFAREVARLLQAAKDLHVTVKVGNQLLGTYRRAVSPNCNMATLAKLVPGWSKRNDCIYTGRFKDGIGYVMITTWGPAHPKMLDSLYSALDEWRTAKAIIIDVRPNSGGDELLAQAVAGCFAPKAAIYSKNSYRDPKSKSGFGEVFDRVIEPRKDRKRFAGKVAVLMGIENMSSCESFLLMMRQDPNCSLFGERSYGSSGNPKPHDLGNAVTVNLSSWKDMQPDGTPVEGKGIEPDEAVRAQQEDLVDADPVLEAALNWLRK